MMTIIRAIQRIEFEFFEINSSVDIELNNSYNKIRKYILSNQKYSNIRGLDEISTPTPREYSDMQSFILRWIEIFMCETEWVENDDSMEILYHNAHLCIPRIYATLLIRETAEFYSRITTTYRDSFQVTRTPTINEQLQLNDYTYWTKDALIPAVDDQGIVRYITPFKMKVYVENGVTWRELIGGGIVQPPHISSIVFSFKSILQSNDANPVWYQSLSLQYEGLYWEDSISYGDLARLDPRSNKPAGKAVNEELADSKTESNKKPYETAVKFNNPIFVNQLVISSAKYIESYNKILDEIIRIQQDVSIELDQNQIRTVAERIYTFYTSRVYPSINSAKSLIYDAKSRVFNALAVAIGASGVVKFGLKNYYSPSRWGNFYNGPLKTARGAIIRQANAQMKVVKELQISRIHTYDHLLHTIDHNILTRLKYAYGFAKLLSGDVIGGTSELGAVYAAGCFVEQSLVSRFIEAFAKGRFGILASGTAAITAGAEILIATGLVALFDYFRSNLKEGSLKKEDPEEIIKQKTTEALSLGYAPDAYAFYGIRIPMYQFGHLIDVSTLRQFLKRQEIILNDGTIATGDAIEFVDRRFENYDWTRNSVIGKAPTEGLWPVNFAPLESIERAKSGVKLDFDRKIEKQQQHPDLKDIPPKLGSSEEVSLFFPKYPWGITPSICIPTFEDAAKEAVKTNILAQGDLNNIYEYNEFMNTVGKIVTTPLDDLVPNISKVTAISFAESYVNSLRKPLVDKLISDTVDVINISNSESENGEFTSGTSVTLGSSGTTLVVRPHRRVSQSQQIVFTSRPSIRPNSENKTKDGKNIPIGQRTSTSDYVKKSIRTYFPDNKITRPYNNDYKSNVPPITVKVSLPSFANGNGLRDVSSTDPLVRVLTQTERNALRSSSSPGSVSNIEDHILTDVSIKLGASGPKLDTDLFEKGCELKRPERGDKPTRPDRDTGPRDTGPGVRTCFPSYVKVLTPNGYIEISSMNIGDKITAFDEDGNLVESSVTYKFIHDGEEMSEVFEYELSNGNKLHITDNHPVLVPSGEFLQIGWLNMGDSVVGENNEEIQIISKKFVEKTIVYNLEVEKYHTYIAEGVRVHNLTNKWAGRGSGFDPRIGGRNRPGLIIIDSSEWENGGGQGDDTKNSESGNQEAVGSGRDNPFLPTCFPSWSIVTTENGKKPISEILVGDKIFTLNRESGKIETSVVTDVKKHEDENHSVSRYELSDGGHIDITKNHPVLTPSGYFKSIGKLNIGDLIITENGESVCIINEYHLDDCHVYNLQVESNGSYIVDGIVVSDR
jgi:hypothetical protein